MQETLTAVDRIYQDMRDLIAHGELKPGTRLARKRLADHYGTSSIPVVEAIRRLERDGLVVSHPSWGTLVKTWSIDDIEAAYIVREAVEGHACRLFAQRASRIDRVALQEHGRRFDECDDQRSCNEADIALHLFIVNCSGSSVLYQIAENSGIITAALKSSTQKPLPAGDDPGPKGVHNELIAALNSGDADSAELAGREHVRHGLAKLLTRLREIGTDCVDFGPGE